MALVALKDTKIPNIYQTGLYNEKQMNVSWEHTDKVLTALVLGTTECLSQVKSKEFPVAFEFKESNDEFVCAAVVQFFDGKKGAIGNWNYTWTFNEDDIPDKARKISVYDSQYISFFRTAAFNKYGMIFDQPDYASIMFSYLLNVIKRFLDENANENEEWGVKLDGVIQFRVAVENGKKVFGVEVDPEVKQLIKDDAAIEQ
jgi:hypothetical protein